MFGKRKGGESRENDVQGAPAIVENIEDVSMKTDYPTLFVKIDRYKEILQELHALRTHIMNVKDLMEAVAKIEVVLNEVSAVIQTTIASLESVIENASVSLATLDSEFVKPRGMEFSLPKGELRPELTASLQQLHSELEKIKEDIRAVSQ